MKQTNNAIKFLMAQYRAIFKNAYFKGLTSAVVLTAGLAAGQANALDNYFIYSNSSWSGTSSVTDNATQKVTGKYDQESGVVSGGKLTIGASGASGTQVVKSTVLATGGYANTVDKNLNATASNNELIINAGGQISGGSAVGGIASSNLLATASDNKLTVTLSSGSESSGDQFTAGRADSKTAAIAKNNTLKISISGDRVPDFHTQVFGGLAQNSIHSKQGDFIARENHLDITGVTFDRYSGTSTTSASGTNVITAGAAFSFSSGTNTVNLVSYNNTADLKGIIVGAETDTKSNTISANQASGKSGSNVSAIGEDGILSLKISDSNLYRTDVHGGIAQSNSGGDAIADFNSVEISNTDILTDSSGAVSNIWGGRAETEIASGGDTIKVSASNNSVSITSDNTNSDVTHHQVVGNIHGGRVWLEKSSGTTSLENVSLTANNNSVHIGTGVEVNLSGAGIYGARIVVNSGSEVSASGSTINASNNSVTIDGIVKGTSPAGIFAVQSVSGSGLMLNNDVTINGTVTDVNTIAGGMGADSVVTIGQSGKLITSTINQDIRSDVVNISGILDIGNDKSLTISGFYKNGDATTASNPYYTNATTFDKNAKLYNAGTLELLGDTTVEDGATLHAVQSGAEIKVDGDTSKIYNNFDKESGDILTKDNMVGGRGALNISVKTLNSYLTAGDTISYADHNSLDNQKDAAGAVTITSGGVLNFTNDQVVLSNFNYTSGSKAAGKIQVDADISGGGSVLKGKTVVIEHAFAGNATTATKPFADSATSSLNDDLQEIVAKGIKVEADVLKLGSSKLLKEQSAEILFAEARAKNEIDFSVSSGEFQLHAPIYGSNYKHTYEQQAGLDYYTALNGTINGNVNIAGSGTNSGSLNIQDGNWVANDSIRVSSSGTLTVGGASAAPGTNSLPNATLAIKGDLTLDVSKDGEGKVSVTGKDSTRFDYDNARETAGDDRFVMLDLSNGLVMNGTESGSLAGTATLEVTSGGVIRANAEDINKLLSQNNASGVNQASGAFLVAKNGGAFEVKGEVKTNFVDFSSSTEHGIDLSSNGYLVADGLVITNEHDATQGAQDDATYLATAKAITLNGNVVVDSLTVNDYQQTNGTKPAGSNSSASKVTIQNGTAYISKKLSSSNHTLALGNASGSANLFFTSDLVKDEGSISVQNILLESGSKVEVTNGKWDASSTVFTLNNAESQLIVGNDSDNKDTAGNKAYADLLASGFKIATAGASLNVHADGKAAFGSFDIAPATSGTITVAGELIINGDANAKLADGSVDALQGIHFSTTEGAISIANNGIVKFSSDATNAAILKDGTYKGAQAVTDGIIKGYSKIENKGGELHLGFANTTTFDADAIIQLKKDLFTTSSFTGGLDSALAEGGILNIGQAQFSGFENALQDNTGTGLSGYKADWTTIAKFSDVYGADVTNDSLTKTNVYGIKPGDQVQGHWGSLSTEYESQTDIAGHTSLRFAQGNNGYFISDASHSKALGATIHAQKSLALIDGGKIGKITLQSSSSNHEKNLTKLEITGAGTTYIDSIATQSTHNSTNGTYVKVNANTEVADSISGLAYLDVAQKGNLKVLKDVSVHEIETLNGTATIENKLTFNEANVIGGSVSAKDAVFAKGSSTNNEMAIANEGIFTAQTLTVDATNSDKIIRVGLDDLPTDKMYKDVAINGTGYLDVNTLELNGNTLVVDPAYGEKTSISGVINFKDSLTTSKAAGLKNDAGTLNGNLWIGNNAAQGIGATKEETLKAISTYQTNGSLDENKYGSILYLNGQLTLANNSEIALNAHNSLDNDEKAIRDTLKYRLPNQVDDQYAALGLGANTVILMTEKAFEDDKGERTGTAIFFDRKAAVVNGAGGDIVLDGDFDAATQLNIFNDLDDNGVDVKGSIDVRTQNGFLYATLTGDNQGKGVQLHVDKNKAYVVMNEASTPVVETLISYHEDRIVTGGATKPEGDKDSVPATEIKPIENKDSVEASKILVAQEQKAKEANSPSLLANGPVVNVPGDKPETPEGEKPESGKPDNGETQPKPPVNTAKITGYSDFLNEVVNTSHGAPAEAAARLAVYGGVMQAALATNNTSVDAISARMGMGASEISSIASNGQGGTLWVTPVYKSQDSDNFAAQGLDYGVDLNLYGLALGGDIEVAKNFKVGAMFNVGSGDADGKGNVAAASTSNDFNYYGFAVYGGYNFDAFSLSADLGYTVLDSDLEANTIMQNTSKLTASTDTKAITFGVTGKYTLSLDNGVEIAPHAGVRFTRFDMDSYTIKGNGNTDVAHFSGDNLNIFSIPVGVTVSKEYVGESWTIKPSLDFTLTGNFGDDEINGDVSWTGVNNLKTSTASEFVDNFTYGVSAGISAQTGSFVMGTGISYAGSSNVSEFGVNANIRFLF